MSELTERERWMICQGFRQGYGQGHNDTVESAYNSSCEQENEGAIDWLDDYVADGVTVADVLAKEAPTTELAADKIAEMKMINFSGKTQYEEELEERIEKLEAAIKIHLREEGFSDEPETVEWWVEQHQPFGIQTTPKDKDDE